MTTVDSFFKEAQSAHQLGDLMSAEQAYRSCLDTDPDHVGALNLLGVVLGQRLAFASGVPFLKRASSLAPDRVDIHLNLAHALHQSKEGHLAIKHLKSAYLNWLPGCFELVHKLGDLMYDSGNYADAIGYYKEAILCDPTRVTAYFKLAQTYLEIHHFKDALFHLNWVLSLDPTHAKAQQQVNSLAGLDRPKSQFKPVLNQQVMAQPDSESPLALAYLELLKDNLIDAYVTERGEPDHNDQSRELIWPIRASTMIGRKRMDNLHACLSLVRAENISGDLIETGVWRGGATIFMRGFLKAYDDQDRKVWVADSFEGLPPPNAKRYPSDQGGLTLHRERAIKVSMAQVLAHFERYGVLDSQVQFLKGYFKDTLPQAPIKKLALMRLDGDMYESTMDALVHLYPRLSQGGFVIVDDYGAIQACRDAVDDFFKLENISPSVTSVDSACVYWRK